MARILIADDDPEYRAAFCDGMKALGHEVTSVPSGAEVAVKMKEQAFDIVFLDVFMKGGGAITLVHSVRMSDPEIPIIIITGKLEIIHSPLFEQGLRLAQAKVSKTSSLIELERLVTQYVGA